MSKKKAVIISVAFFIIYSGVWLYVSSKVKEEFSNNYSAQEIKVSGFPLAQNIEAKGVKFLGMEGKGKILENITISQVSVKHNVNSSEYIVDTSKPVIISDDKLNISVKLEFSPDSKMKIVDNHEKFTLDYEGSSYKITTTNTKSRQYFTYEVKNPRTNIKISTNNIVFINSDSGYNVLNDKAKMILSADSSLIDVKVDINDKQDIAANFSVYSNGYMRGEDGMQILEVFAGQQAQLLSMMAPDFEKPEGKSNFSTSGSLNLEKNLQGTMVNTLPAEQMQQLDPKMRQYYQKPAPDHNINLNLNSFKYSNADYNISLDGKVLSSLDDQYPYGKLTLRIDGFDKFVEDVNTALEAANKMSSFGQNAMTATGYDSGQEAAKESNDAIIEYIRVLASGHPSSTKDSLLFDMVKQKGSGPSFTINQVEIAQIMEYIKQLETDDNISY